MKSKKPQPKKPIHYNNQDIAQKALQAQFNEGTLPLIGLEYETQPVKEVLPTGIANIETRDDEADFLFRLKDGTLLHIEFQSNYKKWDVIRFAGYHLHFYNTYKDSLEKLDAVEKIKTVVIYSKESEDGTINANLDTGNLTFNMDTIHIASLDGDTYFETIKDKIKSDPNVVLSKKEEQQLIYNPYMSQKSSINDRALEIVEVLVSLEDEEAKFRILGTLATLTYKDLTDESLKKIWEVFEMGAVFEKFQKERDEEREKQIFEMVVKALDMLSKGADIEEVVEETGLELEKVRQLKNAQS